MVDRSRQLNGIDERLPVFYTDFLGDIPGVSGDFLPVYDRPSIEPVLNL
jgi:hypothetical protein